MSIPLRASDYMVTRRPPVKKRNPQPKKDFLRLLHSFIAHNTKFTLGKDHVNFHGDDHTLIVPFQSKTLVCEWYYYTAKMVDLDNIMAIPVVTKTGENKFPFLMNLAGVMADNSLNGAKNES